MFFFILPHKSAGSKRTVPLLLSDAVPCIPPRGASDLINHIFIESYGYGKS